MYDVVEAHRGDKIPDSQMGALRRIIRAIELSPPTAVGEDPNRYTRISGVLGYFRQRDIVNFLIRIRKTEDGHEYKAEFSDKNCNRATLYLGSDRNWPSDFVDLKRMTIPLSDTLWVLEKALNAGIRHLFSVTEARV